MWDVFLKHGVLACNTGAANMKPARRKEVAAAVRQCCTHSAPGRCLLGFHFRKVMVKH